MTDLKNKTRSAITLIVISLLIVAPAAVSHTDHDSEVSSTQENSICYSDSGLLENNYEERGPIHIDGNEDFEVQAAEEGWPGDGTEDDPYVIEGYRIDGGDESSIYITDTEVYFIVRGNMIEGGTPWGITTLLTPNGNIIGNTIIGADRGIRVHSSDYITIENNFVSSSESTGLELSASVGTMINNNTLVNNQGGFFAMNSDENILMDNNIYDNERRGIGLYHCNYNIMSGNKLSGHETYGIEFYSSAGNMVINNIIFDNDLAGIHVDVEPGGGSSSRDNVIYDNNFIENGEHVINRGDNHYYNESKSLGNYWSDYEEKYPDAQELNGIWDTPYEGDEVVPFIDEYPQVDPGVPYINIVHPEDGGVIDEPELTVSWSGRYRFEEELKYEVRLNDEPWEHVGVDTEYDIVFDQPDVHRFEIRVENVLTEQVGGTVDFSVDIEPDIIVSNFTVYPSDGFRPLAVYMTAELENIGSMDGEISLYIGDMEYKTWTVAKGETVFVDEHYVFDEHGTYVIEFGGLTKTVVVYEPEFIPDNVVLDVFPLQGEAPLEANITVSADNVGDVDGSIDVVIDGTVEHTLDISAEDSAEDTFTHTFDDPGSYEIVFGNLTETVVVEEPEFIPDDLELDVTPLEGEAPLEVTITVSADNIGDADGSIDVVIDSTVEHTLDIPAEDSAEHTFTHTFDDPGFYDVEFGNLTETVVVEEPADDPEFIPDNLELMVDPTEGESPLNVTITVRGDNVGLLNGSVDVVVDDIVVHTLLIPAEGSVEHTFNHTFTEPGNYTITFHNLSEIVVVTEPVDVEPTDTESSMWMLAAVGIAIAVVLAALLFFMKKKGGTGSETLDDEDESVDDGGHEEEDTIDVSEEDVPEDEL